MRIRIVDTETCGVEAPDLQIVQIAAVDLVSNSQDGAKDSEWVIDNPRLWYINPGRLIPVEAMAVHHTTDAMVADKPAIDAVQSYIFNDEADSFISHNTTFDIKVLDAAGVRAMKPWACTYKGAVVQWPGAPSHKNQVLRYFLGLNLSRDLPVHNAYGDAIVTAHIAMRLLSELSLHNWLELSSRPVLLPRVHFGEHAKKSWSDVPQSYLHWMIYKSKGEWDPDVLFTAKHWYAIKDKSSRSRGPQLEVPQWEPYR